MYAGWSARLRALRASALFARTMRGALAIWAVLSFALAGNLMLGHSFALPRPASDRPELRDAIARSRRPSERGRWLALHVLYAQCRCSQRVLAHLFARHALADVAERVVLVAADASASQEAERAGAALERSARASGFAFETVAAPELAQRYRLQAAPAFLVADPAGEIRYLGGYTERKQGFDNRDLAILAALRRGESASELPLFGCAVSRELQRMFDPLGLRERR